MVYLYVPIWYKKANETVIPLVKSSWTTTKEYAYLGWIKSEPYRNMAVAYYLNAIEYVS